jgi:ADP-heptose:LPS heptosyltransferase
MRVIKQRFPDAEVHFLTKKQNAALLAHNPYLSRLHLFAKRRLRRLVRSLRCEHYDYVIDLHRNLRTWRLKRKLRVKSISFCKLNVRKWLLTTLKINRLPKIHIIDRYLAPLKQLNILDDRQGLDFIVPSDVVMPSFFDLHKPFVALVIGANHNTKKMPYHMLLSLCKKIDCQVAALGGITESCDGERLATECHNVHNFCGKLDIYQSSKALQLSALVVSPDTGLMHIAAALKKDIFSVWGNTVPDFGMYPYMAGNRSQFFEVKDLSCRPCSKIGYKSCPRGHFNCMNRQDLDKLACMINHHIINY